jgi:hypothetical protein
MAKLIRETIAEEEGLGGIGFFPAHVSKMIKSLYHDKGKSFNDIVSESFNKNKIIEATYDEFQLNRILKMPNVRGIRVYLAISDRRYNAKTKKCERVEPHLSFVLVGVDENGNDVVYENEFSPNCECGGNCEACNENGAGIVEALQDKMKDSPQNKFKILEF